jgi:hypothetical protein
MSKNKNEDKLIEILSNYHLSNRIILNILLLPSKISP